MNRSELRSRFRKLFRRPQMHLAWSGMREALKQTGVSLPLDGDSFVIFVIPAGYRGLEYEAAAHELIDEDRNDWFERSQRVRLADPPPGRPRADGPVTICNLKGLSILIAEDLGQVEPEVCFASAAVMFVRPPGPRQISAARRLSGRAPISDDLALRLSLKPEKLLLAAMHRRTIGEADLAELDSMDRPAVQGPTLLELPGFEEAKEWAAGLASDVARWREGLLSWSEVCRGALIAGPPGSGKTFFAAALARLLGFRLVAATVGGWQAQGALGEMLAAMRGSFREAEACRGAVLLIDEIDTIGSRSTTPRARGGDRYRNVVVSEFLSLLTAQREGVVVVGATNHPESVDAAVLRSGRLERRFTTTFPNAKERAEILAFHASIDAPTETFMEIAEQLGGVSAAEVEETVRRARKRARDEGRALETGDLRAEVPEKMRYSIEQQFRLAVHEAGHALVSVALGHSVRATIEIHESFDSSADAHLGGMTSYELADDRIPTEGRLLDRIAVALAGMAAEAVVFTDRSIGSGGVVGSDVERATSIARRMVGSYGFGSPPVFVGSVDELAGKRLPPLLEQQIVGILDVQYQRALAMLTEEREQVIALAKDAVTHGLVSIDRAGLSDAA
nr:AAA family ATPase [Neorhizobium tomejilense]